MRPLAPALRNGMAKVRILPAFGPEDFMPRSDKPTRVVTPKPLAVVRGSLLRVICTEQQTTNAGMVVAVTPNAQKRPISRLLGAKDLEEMLRQNPRGKAEK